MIENKQKFDQKMLVLGAPRTGFALLLNILGALGRVPYDADSRAQRAANILAGPASEHLYHAMMDFISQTVPRDEVIYNGTFHHLLGGPKWVDQTNPNQVCVRKYVGVKDLGDFTLLTYLPKFMLHFHDRLHSHYHPKKWAEDPDFADLNKFSSMRNPVGAIYSASYSINSITGEYIKRFIGDEGDLREKSSLFRLSDLELVKGLATHLSGYLNEFSEVQDAYQLFRWEDIIERPVPTIQKIAQCRGMSIAEGEADAIWSKIGYKNLTGAHGFNFRAGKQKGKTDDWKSVLVNEHLDIIRDAGLEKHMEAFGYGRITYFKESEYSEFQKKVKAALDRGEVLTDGLDKNMQIFNWNKSNISQTNHDFKRFGKKEYSQIERADFKNDQLLDDFSVFIEEKMGLMNHFLMDVVDTLSDVPEGEWQKTLASLSKKSISQFRLDKHPDVAKSFHEKFHFIEQNL